MKKKVRSPKKNMRPQKEKKAQKQLFTCARCEKTFPSRQSLKVHSKSHLQALRELKMLEEGIVPDETKMGSEFKGKNKIIVT